eukprot:TRINITY_DN1725_c0_g1_i12.p1 TRINITY_DN1725_c0_g1~~TRINITY_DN1725_c0_g1_i12.p1  ORF type:complete len:547 (-),score=76.09 TRINITY_DN1725_c0_g1_i12:425-1909(-)
MSSMEAMTDATIVAVVPEAATDDFAQFYRLSCVCLMICSAVAIYISCPAITPSPDCTASFYKFRRRYLIAWYVCATVDWLQGAFLFALYEDVIKVPTGILLAVGYGSSILMGPVSGFLGDRFGRRRCCLLYCFTYGIACFLLHVVDFFPGLVLGRFLSAFSQEILWTSFESYLVTAYTNEGLPGDSLGNIFAWMFFGNFLCAIFFGGLVAQFMVDRTTLQKGAYLCYGDHFAPFTLALCLCAVGAILIYRWKDDLSVEDGAPQDAVIGASTTSIRSTASASKRKTSSFAEMGMTLCGALRQRNVQLCGMAVVGVEGPMFFLIMHFYDTLKSGGTFTSGGYVFASFMMCSMMGSTLCSRLSHMRAEQRVLLAACAVASGWVAISGGLFANLSRYMFVPLAFFAFNVIEMGIGIYFPSIGMVKSACVPEEVRSSVYTMYRLPLNIITTTMVNLRVIKASGPLGVLLGCSAVAAMFALGSSQKQARTSDLELSNSFS